MYENLTIDTVNRQNLNVRKSRVQLVSASIKNLDHMEKRRSQIFERINVLSPKLNGRISGRFGCEFNSKIKLNG